MKTAVASFVASALLSTLASASTYTVAVGQNGFRFTPNNTVASIGDKVEFHYYPKNHSVVQGDFSHACMNDNGFYSGYVPVAAGSSSTIFTVTINSTDPIYYYCSQPALGGHCAQGMVGCINCPASGNTLAAYAMAAMNTTNATVNHPAAFAGGTLSTLSNATSSSMNASASPTIMPFTGDATRLVRVSAMFLALGLGGALFGVIGV